MGWVRTAATRSLDKNLCRVPKFYGITDKQPTCTWHKTMLNISVCKGRSKLNTYLKRLYALFSSCST